MAITAEQIKARRIERMRLGQSTCQIINLPDAELRFALVPLTEEEFDMGIAYSASIDVEDNLGGAEKRDRAQMHSDIFHAARQVEDLNVKYFDSIEAVKQLDLEDINRITQMYVHMSIEVSPSLDGISEEELEELKKASGEIAWSELNGPQWIALKHYLLLTMPELLMAKLSGSTSIDS